LSILTGAGRPAYGVHEASIRFEVTPGPHLNDVIYPFEFFIGGSRNIGVTTADPFDIIIPVDVEFKEHEYPSSVVSE
jgi:hypothetical protein